MESKNILIIGAGSGIGEALLKRLNDKNAGNLYASSRSIEKIISASNVNAFELDVTAEGVVFPEINGPIHALVYCPGSILLKPFRQLKLQELQKDMEVNVFGFIRMLQHYEQALKEGNASVVAFSTVAVGTGMPFHTSVAAAKGALEGVVKSLAAEWAPEVRLNVIAPSLTDTPLAARLLRNEQQRQASEQRHPLKKIGTADELAAMAEFLISEDAAWITGQVFHVDGGMSALRVG